jgi:hypothetical protein
MGPAPFDKVTGFVSDMGAAWDDDLLFGSHPDTPTSEHPFGALGQVLR